MKTNLFADVVNIIRQACHALALNRRFGNIEATHSKSHNASDAVTELDRSVEQALAKKLKRLAPDIEFTGEEFGGNRAAKRRWICDPIDGTGCFIRGIPHCTCTLALIEDGQVELGVIYDFVRDDAYTAIRGEGARCNNEQIKVSDRPLQNAYLCVSEPTSNQDEMARQISSLGASTMRFRAAGYEFALVASGKLDGKIRYGQGDNIWDVAAGSLLVQEAGGVVLNIGSNTYDVNNTALLATNAKIAHQLRKSSLA